MASKGVPQQQSAVGLAMDDQEPRARADEIPELRRGSTIPRGRYLASDLPPLHTLTEIFADMASNALKMGFEHVLSRLGSRPLRVATMCSGTEAPLLALELIQTGLAEAHQLRVSHAFSCEIVPFKQSYIERNFRPPILFRDITELGGDVARTAYGSSEVIPGDLDILVAGTACVDFSPLNNRKKTLQQGGESGATFDGLLRYAERYRPRMVIQENVRNAPWGQMKGKWEELGYMSVCVNVDTKHYYIPQTRERGYMVVIDKRRLEAAGLLGGPMDQSGIENVTQRVCELAGQFKRPASAPVGLFLLSDDDRRLELIEMRARLESRSETSWDQYQIRHERHRGELELGIERPITRSLPGVNDLKAPDFYWHRFWKTQPERVWETADMNFLKKMLQDYDMNFKERWIDLSQGVDRGNDSLAGSGIAGCLTPKGIPFVTTRGGPVSGTEALSLQGLPLDRMLLTRETQADLMDMAGNAMTSTVVCAIMLAGLIAVHEILDDDEGGSTNPGDAEAKSLLVHSEVHSLVRSNFQIAEALLVDHSVLKAKAASSVLCCSCERQTGVRDSIFSCTLCGHTACKSCRGNPTHSYLRVFPLSRQKPSEFIANLKGLVPMKLMLSGLSELDFETFRTLYPIDNLPQFWPDFILCVKAAVVDVFQFYEIKRGIKWRVVYDGTHSSLFLDIGPDSIQWLLYAKPPKSASTRSVIREVLAKPIARMSPTSGSFVGGTWEVCSPVSTPFSLHISGRGSRVRSFQSECGLKAARFVDSKVWDSILVEGSSQDVAVLDHDVRGTYQFLPDCGTALGALYRKKATAHAPPMFLFLDPTKTGPPDEDACVFALDHSRLPGYDVRMTIAELSPAWRSLDVTLDSKDVTAFCRRWAEAPKAQLNHCPAEQIILRTLQPGTQVSIENQHCNNACITLTSLSATGAILNLPNANSDWQVWNPDVSHRELKGLAWLFPKIAAWPEFEDWNEIIRPDCSELNHHSNGNCNTCNPPTPSILWGRDTKGRIIPYENPQDAAVYERAIKNRPSPFLVFRRINEHGDAELRFTLNVQALTHQAHGKLVGTASRETVTSRWRLIPHAYDMAQKTPDMSQATPDRFTLKGNDNNSPSPQPPNFKFQLRDEQLRSLSWMISQEAENMEPFMEEEVEESILPLMPWRAEAKATMPKVVRGGVLADEVGYGKTAVVLGLIDAQYESDTKPPEDDGLIPTKATLIIVPVNVFKQWISEIKKFLAGKYKVLVINSFNKLTIRDVEDADIVILSWSTLASDTYYSRLQQFTGTPRAPAKSSGGTGRNFDSWFHDARASLRESVDILRTEGPEAMLQQLEARRRRVQETQADFTYVPSRRLRGQAFADANNGRDESDAEAEAGDDLNSEADAGLNGSGASGVGRSTGTASSVGQRKRRHSSKSVEGPDGKRQKRESTDPAEVADDKQEREDKSKAVTDDRKDFDIQKNTKQQWRDIKAVFLHAFNFNRLVIDEYTYAGEEKQTSLLSLQARSKWILSGTPGLDEFADIKSIARYLGVHLGVDDDGDCDKPSQNLRLRNIRKNHTAVEAFQYYQAPHSNAWYRNRREHAQRFLDRFARQNVARITNIPLIPHLVITEQSPAEKTAYDTLFRAVKENKRRIPGPLSTILSKSQFPQETLIMSCVTSQIGQPLWNLEKCHKGSVNDKRKSDEMWTKVESITRQAATVWYGQMNNNNPKDWQNALNGVAKGDFGDLELNQRFNDLLKTIIHTYSEWKFVYEHRPIDDLLQARFQKAQDAKTGNTATERSVWTAVEKALSADATSLLKQLLDIDREYRFYEHLVTIQTIGIPPCENCKISLQEKEDVNILKTCGHALCTDCLHTASNQSRKPCPIFGCSAHIVPSKIVPGEILVGEDQTPQSTKLNELVEIIRSVPEDELVIIFVQISHLLPVASNALKAADIEHRMVTPTNLKGIGEFTDPPKPKKGETESPSRPKALILNLGNSMAAGLNLQCANHVIFLSPYFASSGHEYQAGMTQAIGRARRFGQKREVHTYHLLVKNTYEVNIFQKAQSGKLVERQGVPVLVPEGQVLPDDVAMEGEELPE